MMRELQGTPILLLRSGRRAAGIERRMLLLAAALREAGARPRIAVFYRQRPGLPASHPLLALGLAAGIPTHAIDDPGPAAPGVLARLASLIRTIEPAIVHTNDYRTDLLARPALRLARSTALHVATCHGHIGANPKLRLYEALDRRALQRCAAVAGVSAYQCAQLIAWGVRASRVRHIPNAVEPGWERPVPAAERARRRHAWGLTDGQIAVGFFGRHSTEKGLDTLLAGWECAGIGERSARLIVAGESDPRKRTGVPAPAGVGYVGYQEDMRAALAACDLIAVPSRREAFGLVALEALAVGRSVVAARVGGLPEVVRDGVTGRLVAPDAPAAWAAALATLVADPPLAAAMGRAGQEDVLRRFPACDFGPAMLSLYVDLLRGALS